MQPGSSGTIAVSLKRSGVSPRHGGVAIFDEGVKRPLSTQDHTGSNRIEFSDDPSVLYGYNNETSEFGFREILVDTDGATETQVYRSFIAGYGVDIEVDGAFSMRRPGWRSTRACPRCWEPMSSGMPGRWWQTLRPVSSTS